MKVGGAYYVKGADICKSFEVINYKLMPNYNVFNNFLLLSIHHNKCVNNINNGFKFYQCSLYYGELSLVYQKVNVFGKNV